MSDALGVRNCIYNVASSMFAIVAVLVYPVVVATEHHDLLQLLKNVILAEIFCIPYMPALFDGSPHMKGEIMRGSKVLNLTYTIGVLAKTGPDAVFPPSVDAYTAIILKVPLGR